jgi:hypothetical protein
MRQTGFIPTDFQSGQKLFALYDHNVKSPTLEGITITKIGRQWVSFARDSYRYHADSRFNPNTMRIDGGNYTSPGDVWISEEDWKDDQLAQRLWMQVRNRMPPMANERMTPDVVRQIGKMIYGSEFDADALAERDFR